MINIAIKGAKLYLSRNILLANDGNEAKAKLKENALKFFNAFTSSYFLTMLQKNGQYNILKKGIP